MDHDGDAARWQHAGASPKGGRRRQRQQPELRPAPSLCREAASTLRRPPPWPWLRGPAVQHCLGGTRPLSPGASGTGPAVVLILEPAHLLSRETVHEVVHKHHIPSPSGETVSLTLCPTLFGDRAAVITPRPGRWLPGACWPGGSQASPSVCDAGAPQEAVPAPLDPLGAAACVLGGRRQAEPDPGADPGPPSWPRRPRLPPSHLTFSLETFW